MRLSLLLALTVLGFSLTSCAAPVVKEEVFLRINQVGYLPKSLKTGTVFSATDLTGKPFSIVRVKDKKEIFTGILPAAHNSWGKWKYVHKADFSSVQAEGEYYLSFSSTNSVPFPVNSRAYSGIIDSLLSFFKVQRCGPTNPLLHEICHLFDSPYIKGEESIGQIDLTGGWHDAGDYVKFIQTTAFSTYMLLLSYQQNRLILDTDKDKNGAPDILEEARVGLDWLIRCRYAPGKLVNQVQDLRDHTVGWRLPENDSLKYDRPAFASVGKNTVGIYAATMALAASIWRSRFYDEAFAGKLLNLAEEFYSGRSTYPDLDKSNSGMYQDSDFRSKLTLAAIELYKTTGNRDYKADAERYAIGIQPEYWWSWGNLSSLALFRVASENSSFTDQVRGPVGSFSANSRTNPFGEGSGFTWGTTHLYLGIGSQSYFLNMLDKNFQPDTLALAQADYILGNNPWGVSFIYGFGKKYTGNFHSQIAHFRSGRLPGGIAAGPAPESVLKNYTINRTASPLDVFNTPDVKYYDAKDDYITNEPTIVTNATAIYFFSTFLNRMKR